MFTFTFSKSFVINFNQACFQPPLGFFDDFCASLSAFFAGVFSGRRKRCPYQVRFSAVYFVDKYQLYFLFFVNVQSSQLYMKMLSMWLLSALIFISRLAFLISNVS